MGMEQSIRVSLSKMLLKGLVFLEGKNTFMKGNGKQVRCTGQEEANGGTKLMK